MEKRKYPRYDCIIKVEFEFFDGDPDDTDQEISIPNKGKGRIHDISQGGAFIITGERVAVNHLVRLAFSTKANKYRTEARIIRTGIIQNNPSEIALRLLPHAKKNESYIACEFTETLADFTQADL